MQAQLAVHLEQMGLAKAITVKCLYVPSYSPKIELGWVRDSFVALAVPPSSPDGNNTWMIEQQLEQFLESNQFLSAEQVQKRSYLLISCIIFGGKE